SRTLRVGAPAARCIGTHCIGTHCIGTSHQRTGTTKKGVGGYTARLGRASEIRSCCRRPQRRTAPLCRMYGVTAIGSLMLFLDTLDCCGASVELCRGGFMAFDIFLMGDLTGSYHDMIAQVCRAEQLDFHRVWLGERHLANGDLLWPSPMVAASFLAARTQRIRIGLAARILPFHHPLQVAADALTLDVLTRGRFDLGLTRGSMDEQSHAAFGISHDEARQSFDEHY